MNACVVFYESTETTSLAAEQKFSLFENILKKGYSLKFTQSWGDIGNDADVVVGNWENSEIPQTQITVCNISNLSQEDSIKQIVAAVNKEEVPWKPWFPVIDYDRCTNCMQCLNFCLFGVYGVSQEEKLEVKKAQNCKTDCPACSRVCPEAAIMFPKYKAGPINGDEVSDADLNREKMKVDISSLLGGDIYALLRERSEKNRSRFGKERDEDRALKERKRCLKQLQKDLDIPDEVLNSLPKVGNFMETTKEES